MNRHSVNSRYIVSFMIFAQRTLAGSVGRRKCVMRGDCAYYWKALIEQV